MRIAGVVTGQILLFVVTLVMVLYFSPSVGGIQAPLLAMALEDRPVRLVFEGGAASPIHGRLGVARPAILDEEDREILKAELIEVDGAGWRDGGPAVGSVLLKKPEVNIFLCPDGSLSLMYLVKEKKRKKRKKEKGSWSVESLRIEDGQITVDLPLITGRIGPFDLDGSVKETRGVSAGSLHLRIEGISVDLRGPSSVVGLLSALGWSPERLEELGPVELRASWDGNRFDLEEFSLGAKPLEVSLHAAVDLDALSIASKGRGTWDGAELLSLDLAISPEQVTGNLLLDPPAIAALDTAAQVSLRGFDVAPLTLVFGGDEAALKIRGVTLERVSQGDAELRGLGLDGELTLHLAKGDLAQVWSAIWANESSAELITRFKPTLGLDMEARLGGITKGELSLEPALRLRVDASFIPPMTLDLRSAQLDSTFGQVKLRGHVGPKPPMGLPGYEGVLQLEGIDLAAARAHLDVPQPLERLLTGHLEGEAVFEGSPLKPEVLRLSRCSFGTFGGEAPMGIHCPEGGTVIDPTKAPEVGPMSLFRKEIPWGEGKLLLGPPKEAAQP